MLTFFGDRVIFVKASIILTKSFVVQHTFPISKVEAENVRKTPVVVNIVYRCGVLMKLVYCVNTGVPPIFNFSESFMRGSTTLHRRAVASLLQPNI